MISGARRFLYITTPYFIPDESLMRALCIAGDGGVDVRLMLPGKPDHWYADCVAESYFGELIKHGVKVYRYTPLSARKKHHGRPRSSLCWLGEYGLPQL